MSTFKNIKLKKLFFVSTFLDCYKFDSIIYIKCKKIIKHIYKKCKKNTKHIYKKCKIFLTNE